MNKKEMALLATQDWSWLTGDQLSWLTRDQLSWLTRDQLRGLTGDQLSWLTRDQLSWLTRDQLSWLTGDQLSWLTRDQLSWLTRESVPAVKSLYSRIAEQIKSDLLTLDQTTFGECNRGRSVCGTPMCIGGTTVWLAGEEGYQLADRYGFAHAALLIHLKSRPDATPPRYDNYPNEWALAYVEERAAEEVAKDVIL